MNRGCVLVDDKALLVLSLLAIDAAHYPLFLRIFSVFSVRCCVHQARQDQQRNVPFPQMALDVLEYGVALGT